MTHVKIGERDAKLLNVYELFDPVEVGLEKANIRNPGFRKIELEKFFDKTLHKTISKLESIDLIVFHTYSERICFPNLKEIIMEEVKRNLRDELYKRDIIKNNKYLSAYFKNKSLPKRNYWFLWSLLLGNSSFIEKTYKAIEDIHDLHHALEISSETLEDLEVMYRINNKAKELILDISNLKKEHPYIKAIDNSYINRELKKIYLNHKINSTGQ